MAGFASSPMTLGLTLLGSIVMVTPLALWVAWTEVLLLAVLAAGILAAVLYCGLVRFKKPAKSAQIRHAEAVPVERLPNNFMEELQGLPPFIHLHRPSGGPKFRRAMHRLKRLLYLEAD